MILVWPQSKDVDLQSFWSPKICTSTILPLWELHVRADRLVSLQMIKKRLPPVTTKRRKLATAVNQVKWRWTRNAWWQAQVSCTSQHTGSILEPSAAMNDTRGSDTKTADISVMNVAWRSSGCSKLQEQCPCKSRKRQHNDSSVNSFDHTCTRNPQWNNRQSCLYQHSWHVSDECGIEVIWLQQMQENWPCKARQNQHNDNSVNSLDHTCTRNPQQTYRQNRLRCWLIFAVWQTLSRQALLHPNGTNVDQK